MTLVNEVEPAKKYLIQIDDDWLAVLLRYWINGGKPCSLLIRPPKTKGTTAVIVNIENVETAEFINKTKKQTDIKIYDYDR